MTASALILGPIGMGAIEKRGLDPEICARLGIHTGRSDNGEVVPDPRGNVIVFPYYENGTVVAEKYRAAGKRFWQKAGGRKTFFNADILDDPSVQDGSHALIVTEGELDCIAALSCGFPFTVSVPDGAPPASEAHKPGDPIDPAADETGKFSYLWNNRERLKRIRRFILAVDNDGPGQRLADELVRRLSASRCLFVTYPDGCKDINDVLMQHGPEAVAAVLNGAQHYPVKGVHLLENFPDRPEIATYRTGWDTIDEHLRIFAPSFTVITGLPGSGKSTWLTGLLVNMAELHGWKSAVFSPEMPIVPHLRDKMRRIVGRSAITGMTKERLANADRFINSHFVFIDHDTPGDEDEDITLEWLMDRAADAVARYGVRILVIDPWNEVEHAKDPRESMTDYVNRSLRQLKKFGQRYGLAIFVVAHPTKDVGKDGKSRVPTLYDIADSSAFFNKPDLGIVIDTPDAHSNETTVYVKKVRFEGTGHKGSVKMRFDHETSRYELLDFGQPQMDMIA